MTVYYLVFILLKNFMVGKFDLIFPNVDLVTSMSSITFSDVSLVIQLTTTVSFKIQLEGNN